MGGDGMRKEEWIQLFLEHTHTRLDYPFKKVPNTSIGVLRQIHNDKWVVLIGEKNNQLYINVKVKPEMVEELVTYRGVSYGYHMNKKHWVTITVNDTLLDKEAVLKLVLLSEQLTK